MNFNSRLFKVPKYNQFNYIPRYYDQEADERKKRREMRLERGAFFKQGNRSRIVGAFNERNMVFRERHRPGSQLTRILLLASMICVPCMVFLDIVPLAVGIPALLGLMVLFVMRVNKL